jgi:putative peptidoglycan lipid II flippase
MSTLSQGWRRASLPVAAPGFNRAILRAAISVGAAGIFVKVLATFKEVAVASVYGRSDAMDAFLAAALIPSLLVNLISESMNQALVPTLVRVREQEGRERAQQLLSPVPCSGCAFPRGCQCRDGATGAWILPAHRLSLCAREARSRRASLLRLLPVVLITGIATNCTAVLNTVDRFALPALAPMVISLAIIFGALEFGAASASGPWSGPRSRVRCCTPLSWPG